MMMKRSPFLQRRAGLDENTNAIALADSVLTESRADIAFVPAATFAQAGTLQSDGDNPLQDDQIQIIELSGALIKQALERSVSYVPKSFGGLLSVAGMRVEVMLQRKPRSRVTSAMVGKQPLDPNRKYKVAMPRALADGQLGYFQIWEKPPTVASSTATVSGCFRKIKQGGTVQSAYQIGVEGGA